MFDVDNSQSREMVRRAAEVALLNAEKRRVYGSVRPTAPHANKSKSALGDQGIQIASDLHDLVFDN